MDDLEIILARLDERSSNMEKAIEQIANDQKETNKVLFELSKEQSGMGVVKNNIETLQKRCDNIEKWINDKGREELARKDNILFEIMKVLAIGAVGGLFSSGMLHSLLK